MREPDRLTRLIEPVIVALGYELIGTEFDSSRRILRVYIDCEAGITLEDCARVSYQISGVLDVEDPVAGRYQLEISSPGLDRPLFKLAHYERFKGSMARLQLLRGIGERRRIQGRLAGVDDSNILVQDGEETLKIPFDVIDKARLVPEFHTTTNKG